MQVAPVRLLQPGLRRLLYVASALVLVAGVELFFLTDHTDTVFAWTIHPGLTAAFLGAGYLSSIFLELLSAREHLWVRARMAAPAVLAFTILTLIATLLHLDRFHFHSPHPVGRFAAWTWLAIYTLVPVLMIVLLVAQTRGAGQDPPRRFPLPRWAVGLVALQGAVMVSIGAALFIAPSDTASIWPWSLTPLTARAVGAWLLGVGVGAIHAIAERDRERLRPAMVAYTLLGALELVALARYTGDVDWSRPAGWVYVGFVLTVLVVGGAGWVMATRL